MKILSIIVVGLSAAVEAVYVASVETSNAWVCDANRGIDIDFTPPSPYHESIEADFPTLRLVETQPAHGNPAGPATTGCGATIEFRDWSTSVHFAIKEVTFSGRLNLTETDYLYHLGAKVEFVVTHQQNTIPIKYPLVHDYNSSTLIDEVWDPKIGNETYLDDFEFTGEITDRKWSPCFRGTEGYGDITKMNFDVSAVAAAPGRGPLVSLLTSGLHVRYGLVWEECYPPTTTWSQTYIKGWESCTYRQDNETSKRHALF